MVGFFKVGASYRFNGNNGKWYSFTIQAAMGEDRYEVYMLGIGGYHQSIMPSFAEGTIHVFTLRDWEDGAYRLLSETTTFEVC